MAWLRWQTNLYAAYLIYYAVASFISTTKVNAPAQHVHGPCRLTPWQTTE